VTQTKTKYSKELLIHLLVGVFYWIPFLIVIIWIPRIDPKFIAITFYCFIGHFLIAAFITTRRIFKKEQQLFAEWHAVILIILLIMFSFYFLIEVAGRRGFIY